MSLKMFGYTLVKDEVLAKLESNQKIIDKMEDFHYWFRNHPTVVRLLKHFLMGEINGYSIDEMRAQLDKNLIQITLHEIDSGLTRMDWAEELIKQLPESHEGRNSWLLAYGNKKPKAK